MIQISIIIPSYNSSNFICTALDSILRSTYQNYEAIIIDDGSADNTKATVEPYLKDKRFKYICQKNKGLAGARNTGIANAKGKYLVFLDADDIIMPDKLIKQYGYLNIYKEIDIVYSGSVFFEHENPKNEFATNFPVYEGDILKHLLYGNFIHVNSVMVRKNKVLESELFNEKLKELEDWDLWLRMALEGAQFGYIPEVLSKVRVHPGSMTANQVKMNDSMYNTLHDFGKLLQKTEKYNELKKDYFKALTLYAIKSNNDNFYSINNKAFLNIGLTYTPFYLKYMIKWWLINSNLIKNSSTTKKLEEYWNNAHS